MTSYLTININKENTTKSRRCKLLRYNVKFNLISGAIPLAGFFVLITSTSTLIAAYIIITIIIIIIIIIQAILVELIIFMEMRPHSQ